ncbi:MAG: ADP-forming succinate--CoA ligase subunit beta [Bacteroidales bacterium]|nr:ADP-forming succinate--CoA ligase subunit beta [Bacteroidales bacterium]
MKIHEYQAKDFFTQYSIPVAEGIVCRDVDSCLEAYKNLFSEVVVIKAQVHTGGRGKAGGVKIAKSPQEVRQHAEAILGMDIKGFKVDRVMVAQGVNIASEYYLSFVIDRNSRSVVLIMSREGGMDIEEVAATAPEKIIKIAIDPLIGIPEFLARKAAFMLFDSFDVVKQAVPLIQNLYKLFSETDASLAEINPLVVTKEGKLIAIDGKMNFDDNALYRQPEVEALFEPDEEEKREQDAKSKGFSYVHLKGKIGCMVNGAGLAMATMDMIKLYGGEPANFLDIGGSSNPNKVIEAMKLLTSDPEVNVVLINIFGGITRCDDVARGLIEAFKYLKTDIPVVIRLTGTNEAEGRELLKGTSFHSAQTMSMAISKSVELSKSRIK